MKIIRPATVAGTFYTANANTLAKEIAKLLQEVNTPEKLPAPKALIAPHAGYIYSGLVAARAYAQIKPAARLIKRVVLLGPAHHVAIRGLALPRAQAFATPLGTVQIDTDAVQLISQMPQVSINSEVHGPEHSLETQLPFLQTLLPDFKLLPLAVGDATAQETAEVLEKLWGGDETLIVVSSDLSHFLSYSKANTTDKATAQSILDLQQLVFQEQACGAIPINGLLLAAKNYGLTPHLIDLRNSGDTAGPKNSVVGYGAFAFTVPTPEQRSSEELNGQVLISLARNAIASHLGLETLSGKTNNRLQKPGATFITLTLSGELRGCIGSLEPHRPLIEDMRDNAVAAAFNDPRFEPLTAKEFKLVKLEVSLLSRTEPVIFTDEADALSKLRPGIDGIIFEYKRSRSTFLPQVWEELAEPREFMAYLKRKAGLGANFWAPEVRLSRYTVQKWKE